MELDPRLQADAARRARGLREQAAELRLDADRMVAQAERIEHMWSVAPDAAEVQASGANAPPRGRVRWPRA